MNELYEPMLARDIKAIPAAIRAYREEHSSEDLFRSVSRFAVLAASPSQHGKHALLACVAAREIEPEMQGQFDELLTECAIYAAQSRLPWSEPPISEPPEVAPDHPSSLDEIRASMEARDRIRGEQWLASLVQKGDVARDFFAAAVMDLSDFGHKLIVAVGLWKLSLFHEQPGSYRFLRAAIGEWTGYYEAAAEQIPGDEVIREELLRNVIDDVIATDGEMEAFHRLVLLDAAIDAAALAGDDAIFNHVAAHLASEIKVSRNAERKPSNHAELELPTYRLARDYAEYLKAFAIAGRRCSGQDGARLIAAAKYNRDHSPSFEEWSFA
jgi:hypothetical protein